MMGGRSRFRANRSRRAAVAFDAAEDPPPLITCKTDTALRRTAKHHADGWHFCSWCVIPPCRLRLERRSARFSAHYRNDAAPYSVCIVVARSDSMDRVVYLRSVAKWWRREKASTPFGVLADRRKHVHVSEPDHRRVAVSPTREGIHVEST